ncbi:G2/mitotic-specific cyclin, partial [Cladochytrium tenue]
MATQASRRAAALADQENAVTRDVTITGKTGAKAAAAIAAKPFLRNAALADKAVLQTAGKKERMALGHISVHQANVNKVSKTTTGKVSTKKLNVEAAKSAISDAQAVLRPAAASKNESVVTGPAAKPRSTTRLPRTRSNTKLRNESQVAPVSKASTPSEAASVESEPKSAPSSTSSAVTAVSATTSVEEVSLVTAPEELEAQDWDDLDKDDINDPMMVSEYVVEIFAYMKELEVAMLPNPNYMEGQKDLEWKMRAILIDWIVDVHHKFRLLPETLYLAVNIIDRFLTHRVVSMSKLQLVGIVAMFIASKYEEIVAPSVKNFLYMSDDGYTEEEILQAERYVLSVLEFNLRFPSPMSFLRRCSKAEDYDVQTRTLAKYLMEISLVDHRFIGIVPSKVSAAALFLARKMLRRGGWNANLRHYSTYTEEELMDTVMLMLSYLEQPSKYPALYK